MNPDGQSIQVPILSRGVNLPGTQSWQLLPRTYFPAIQEVQEVASEFTSLIVPEGQFAQIELPYPGAYFPEVQEEQDWAFGPDAALPGRHNVQLI